MVWLNRERGTFSVHNYPLPPMLVAAGEFLWKTNI